MNKKTLNIISFCIVLLIIVFVVTNKNKTVGDDSDNIVINSKGEIQTKADQYQANILDTIVDENVKSFKEFTKTFEKSSADNVTDGLSKDIFTQYIKYNTSGEIEERDIINTTKEVLKNKTEIENPVNYGDITTVSSSLVNLKIYGNDIAIIQNGVNKGIGSLEKKTNKAPYIASIYMKTADILTETNVPDSLSENHIKLINGLKKYSEGLSMMNEQDSDPAKALLGLNKLKDATTEIGTSFEKIKKTIILNKIDYTKTDPGYFWISNNTSDASIKLE